MIVSYKMVIILISGKKLYLFSMDGVVSNELVEINFFLILGIKWSKVYFMYKFLDLKSL